MVTTRRANYVGTPRRNGQSPTGHNGTLHTYDEEEITPRRSSRRKGSAPEQEFEREIESNLQRERERRSAERKKITFLKRPDLVLYHFACVLINFVSSYSLYLLAHRVAITIVYPCIFLWIFLSHLPGSHHAILDSIRFEAEFALWWIGLGVLSSVGLGTGMHSGILFLFPHIFRVVEAAEECGSTNFNSRKDMWFAADPFQCPSDNGGDGTATFLHVFVKVFPACFLWGLGTALGEIPPYAVSRAASLAGQVDEEFEEVTGSDSRWNVLNRMKEWMIDFLKNHGFWGVFLMAAWPNMAFDLCGICCGHFLMPFWTFFGATMLGKAIVKVNIQAAFFITLFSDRYLKRIIAFIEEIFPSVGQQLEDFLMETRKRFHSTQKGQHETPTGGSVVSLIMNYLMVGFISWFALSCVEQFAQRHAADVDSIELEKLEKELRGESNSDRTDSGTKKMK